MKTNHTMMIFCLVSLSCLNIIDSIHSFSSKNNYQGFEHLLDSLVYLVFLAYVIENKILKEKLNK